MRRPERSSDNEYHFPKRVHDNVVQTPGRPGRFAQPYLKQDPNPGLSWTVQAGCPTCFRQFSQAVGSPSQGNAVNCFYRLHGQPLDGLYQPRDLRACMRRQGLPDTWIASSSKRLQTRWSNASHTWLIVLSVASAGAPSTTEAAEGVNVSVSLRLCPFRSTVSDPVLISLSNPGTAPCLVRPGGGSAVCIPACQALKTGGAKARISASHERPG